MQADAANREAVKKIRPRKTSKQSEIARRAHLGQETSPTLDSVKKVNDDSFIKSRASGKGGKT